MPAAPPYGKAYTGAFPSFSAGELNEDHVTAGRMAAFERRSGKHLAWATFSNHWRDGRIAFPAAAVATIAMNGTLPVVRMMPWSRQEEGGPDPVFSMAAVAAGRWDDELVAWAREARASGVPMLVDVAPEMNGSWFPWNGSWAGGRPGVVAYRGAFRRIVTLFRREGAANVAFAFHVDAVGEPAETWNAAREYFPGARYVDWVGASIYGSNDPISTWEPFAPTLDRIRAQLLAVAPDKPFAVFEWGVAESPAQGSKGDWIEAAFAALSRPDVGAVSWWDERWRDGGVTTDLRISSSPAALSAYRAGIAAARFVTRTTYACAPDRL